MARCLLLVVLIVAGSTGCATPPAARTIPLETSSAVVSLATSQVFPGFRETNVVRVHLSAQSIIVDDRALIRALKPQDVKKLGGALEPAALVSSPVLLTAAHVTAPVSNPKALLIQPLLREVKHVAKRRARVASLDAGYTELKRPTIAFHIAPDVRGSVLLKSMFTFGQARYTRFVWIVQRKDTSGVIRIAVPSFGEVSERPRGCARATVFVSHTSTRLVLRSSIEGGGEPHMISHQNGEPNTTEIKRHLKKREGRLCDVAFIGPAEQVRWVQVLRVLEVFYQSGVRGFTPAISR